eukprot:403360511
MISAGVTASLGDLVCQNLLKSYGLQDQISYKRSYTFFMIGTFYFAPLLHVWFTRFLPRLVQQKDMIGIVKKVAWHSTLFMPLLVLFFYPFANMIDGKTLQQTSNDLQHKLVPTLISSLKVWPLAQFINFTFVPPLYHVLFTNFIQIFFNAYLSYMHNSYHKKHIDDTNLPDV